MRKLSKLISTLLLTGSSFSHGTVVLSYQSGITTTTPTGAADPITQGWTYDGTGAGFSDGYDAGTGVGSNIGGGWRTVDGGSNEVELLVSGTFYNTGVLVDEFATYSITYDSTAGTALLDYVGGTATINPSIGDPNRSTIFMGSGSSGGQGSGVWNAMVIETIPEPGSVMLAFLSLAGLLRPLS